jgi:hypothetical protein
MYHFGICLSKTIKNLKTAEIRIGNRHFQYRSETSPLYRPPRCVRHIPGFESRCLCLTLCSSARGPLAMALAHHRPDIMIPETCILLEGHAWRHTCVWTQGLGRCICCKGMRRDVLLAIKRLYLAASLKVRLCVGWSHELWFDSP